MPDNKYVSKVIYGDEVLIDLTADTITPETMMKGVTAHDKSGAPIVGTCDYDSNTDDATATVAEILVGKTAYVRGTKITGTMPNNEGIEEYITDLNAEVSIPQGYHDGSGKVKIDIKEAEKLTPENIREGVTILNVTGTMSGSEDVKAQARTVTPSTQEQIILPEEGYSYLSQVTVSAISRVESDNAAGGLTITIG